MASRADLETRIKALEQEIDRLESLKVDIVEQKSKVDEHLEECSSIGEKMYQQSIDRPNDTSEGSFVSYYIDTVQNKRTEYRGIIGDMRVANGVIAKAITAIDEVLNRLREELQNAESELAALIEAEANANSILCGD